MKTNHDIKLGVSLYSYQDNYYFKKHDLEGCICAAADAGAEGIEVFPESMMPEWPYISDSFVDYYNGLMERYGMQTVTIDHFADRCMHKNKLLTDDELFERTLWYFKAAKKLGAKYIRMMHSGHGGAPKLADPTKDGGISEVDLTNAKIIERLLPYAAEMDLVMSLECHAPTAIEDPYQQQFLEPARKLGLEKYVGLQIDFSSYEYRPTRVCIDQIIRQGGCEKWWNYYYDLKTKQYKEGFDLDKADLFKQMQDMGGTSQVDLGNFSYLVRRGQMCGSLDYLRKHASEVVYVHGKFHYIGEDGQVDSIDYPAVFKALEEGGYKGFICSEFEGNRFMNDLGEVDEIEFVRKHQILMRNCLSYTDWPEI